MTIADWLMIAAVLIGPIVAVQLTRYLDNKKEKRDRRLTVFKTLMATRGSKLSYQHVEALNRIDLEFSSNKSGDRAVRDAWKAYLDLLGDQNIPADQWPTRRVDLFVELLHKMAEVLDYEFDKTHIKNSLYHPRVYGDIERFQNEMRQALRELLEGKRFLPMFITNLPSEEKKEKQMKPIRRNTKTNPKSDKTAS